MKKKRSVNEKFFRIKIKKGKLKMSNFKISVIIPVYNKGKFLRECLDSVFNQTLDSIQVVIVDDGSTDDSPQIIEEYKKKYNNMKVITQENKGVIAARVAGYENAVGDYIGWVDADDFIEKTMYEKLYKNALKFNTDVSICNYTFYPFKPSKKSIWYAPYNGVVDYKFLQKSTTQCNKIVRKELLDKLNIIDLFKKIGESCYAMVILNTNKIVTLDEELYYYRVGHKSLSTNYKNYDWYERKYN